MEKGVFEKRVMELDKLMQREESKREREER